MGDSPRPADVQVADAESTDAESTDVEPADVEPADADAESESEGPGEREPEATESAPSRRRGIRLRRLRPDGAVAWVTMLVVLTAATVTAVIQWRAAERTSTELAVQKQVRSRAAEFGQAFLVYHDTDLNGWEKRLAVLAAPEYRSAISQAVRMQFPIITGLQADSRVTIRDVFLNAFDGSLARTMVVADTEVRSREFVRTVTGLRLLVELTRQKTGGWLISSVGVLGIDSENMTDHAGKPIDSSKIKVPDVSPAAPAP